ncbi:MAG: AMP-binding protein [Planctomycetes bacterium]|nr:AMP-binding protein [Planctomycetota bacterium]
MKITIDTDAATIATGGEQIPLYGKAGFELISELWVKAGWAMRHSYTFTWLGRPIIQLPEDMLRIQEVIHRVAPDVIIETGIAHGGSLIFYASICKAIGKGRVIGIDIEIRNKNLESVGEVWVRGDSVMNGYLGNPEATREILSDGWLRTGDLGRFDEHGYLVLTGRSTDLIVTDAGKNVYPDEVEARYRDIPFTKELCVFGVPSDEADCSTCVPQGDALIGPGGRYMKDPDVAKESSAILLAINVKLNHEKCDDLDTQEQCEQLSGGVLELTDDMVVVATGDLVLDGALADTPCAEPFGAAIAAVQRFHTPPIKRITGRSRLTVSNNLTLINLATSANASTGGVTVGGAFDNQLTDASCFDWTQGKLLLDGTKLQTFEVAARDLGSVTDLSVADYVIGTLEVAANSHVTFTDNFVNDLKGSSRDSEALYVETLIVGPNATITLNDVRIYYKNPPIIGEQATIIRKVNGELRSIHDPHPALQPAPDGQGSEVPKNRFISLVIPEPAPGDDPKTAIQVKLITLNRTCSADSNNLFTPCSFDDDCVDGVCQTPFATGEGLVRYVNVVKTCQGAGAAGTKLCRGPADCGEAEECLQMRNCAGTSQLCSDDEDCGEGVACLATMSCPDDTFKPAFLCATTGCEPDYRDWAGDLAGGVLHIYGPGIVPGRSEYDVKQMAASCEGNERCTAVSATLRISTARWADLTADGATNAADIAAASDKVKPIPEAFTKPRTMLIPGILNPLRNVNVLELQNTIDAVKSLPMTGLIAGPEDCGG